MLDLVSRHIHFTKSPNGNSSLSERHNVCNKAVVNAEAYAKFNNTKCVWQWASGEQLVDGSTNFIQTLHDERIVDFPITNRCLFVDVTRWWLMALTSCRPLLISRLTFTKLKIEWVFRVSYQYLSLTAKASNWKQQNKYGVRTKRNKQLTFPWFSVFFSFLFFVIVV